MNTLRVPADPPAKLFWSVTVYDITTRCLIDNPQQRGDRGSRDPELVTNDDRSVDIHFGPTEPLRAAVGLIDEPGDAVTSAARVPRHKTPRVPRTADRGRSFTIHSGLVTSRTTSRATRLQGLLWAPSARCGARTSVAALALDGRRK